MIVKSATHPVLSCRPLQQGAFYVKPTTSANYQLAAKEYEHPLSQVISVYDHSQNKIKGFAKVSPKKQISLSLQLHNKFMIAG